MKRICSAALLLGLALTATGQEGSHAGHDAHPPQHHPMAHDADASRGTTDYPVVRWRPDEPLARGMQRLRAATAALSHGGHGHLDDAQVKNIAAELQSAVEAMFAQCRLEPEPDAALHPLLARVLAAATTLRERGFDAGALATLEQVLSDYPRLFDDPAWSDSQID